MSDKQVLVVPPQLARPYRTMILRVMETVVSGHVGELGEDVARASILLASSEMTRVKVCGADQAPAWEGSCFPRPFLPRAFRVWVCARLPRAWPLGPVH